ncbi:Ig-like domain-containing protein [Acinetobacter junii]
MTVTSAVSANGGTVTINADGTLNYTPALNYVGDDVVT